ncbi:MAG: succinylglutamate desuccinylase/aspartoacylase family protein [Chlamydiia bacterium]|nr:succinylglutamate desuccinylase/aspartoacylase family protein [Chlamydiia bacterium]MCP5508855.1 succinylglutamate desuccinylase/aspartoacylase family protein [Chlamydiales bacterium]
MEKSHPFTICNTQIHPGERITIAVPTPEIYTCAPVHLPIHIIHGRRAGPKLLICAAMHADEVNGIAIIERLLGMSLLKKLQGTLITVPVVNAFGLINQSRLLPDGYDLVGSFGMSEHGSFAGRLAHLLDSEILSLATHCVDLHTGEPHRYRLPQIQTNLDMSETRAMAECFGTPLTVHNDTKRGLLWQLYKEAPIPTVIYEGGEALRLDELTIRTGVKGIIRLMRHLGMLKETVPSPIKPLVVRDTISCWAPKSGLCKLKKHVGAYVKTGDVLAEISDPFGTSHTSHVKAPIDGLIISHSNLPLVNEGQPVFEIAEYSRSEKMVEHMESWQHQEQS